jgi:anaerobic selenocysteine-containing dehydrogenase
VKSAHRLLNSSYANLPRHLDAEREPHIDINHSDALARGVADGDRVTVFNDRGALELAARVGDRVGPGVVAMPSGWWASLSPGGAAANTLTCDGLADLAGGGDFHDTRVDVRPIPTTGAGARRSGDASSANPGSSAH